MPERSFVAGQTYISGTLVFADGITGQQLTIIFADSFDEPATWVTNPLGTDTATTGQWALCG